MKIEQFAGEYRWLSNFWLVEIEYEGIKYPSVEHFYVAMKTTDIELRKEISELETSGKAKRFGRTMSIRSDWDDIKVQIMEYGLRQKYSQEPFKSKLLSTVGLDIEEGNTWNDTWWGVNLDTGEGKNILGKLIMKIRGEISE